MCNFCQTNPVPFNPCVRHTGWYVQSICRQCDGNLRVILTNGCVCRRVYTNTLPYNTNFGETNAVPFTNGCCCGGTTGVIGAPIGDTQTGTTTVNGNGCGCGHYCGYGGCSATRFACAQNTVTAQNGDAYYARLYGLNPNTNGGTCGCGCNGAL